ncbi:protein of unknown function [Candidatus Hydrogenisulfobacillus filiaventi]|uniref:FAD/NAD(P)-binding domain-containing protein n=1 Tax=Candidatus Hydrogenisulfobacillus filiaventi TaxID=2707344 RepID=A0A6F8ZJB7_9FIRM|nr:protein of unknown function [Candidatus Hydrogenisulfobacillus filiaventi]
MAAEARRFGIRGAIPGTVDLERLRACKQAILQARLAGAAEAAARPGITVIPGQADFLDAHHLQVRTADGAELELEAGAFLAAPESVSGPLPVPGADDPAIRTGEQALNLDRIPRELLIVGRGYIGCELGTLFARFGSHVRILEKAPRLLMTEDPAVAAALVAAWQDQEPGMCTPGCGWTPSGIPPPAPGRSTTGRRARSRPA